MMLTKYTIVFPSLLLFTALNFAPFFIIDCTEINVSNHLDSIFNRCCTFSMLQMNNTPQNAKETYLIKSHCKCYIEISSEEYLILNSDTKQLGESLSVNDINRNELVSSDRNFQTTKTESLSISVNLVKSEVILI